MTAAQLTKCRCGQGMVTRGGVLQCLHCDRPCGSQNCRECKRAGVKR